MPNAAVVRVARKGRRPILLGIFAIAFAVRVAAILYFDTWHVATESDHWAFGFETGHVAESLAQGNGFASPFLEPTGPTAWLAPAYPWLLSLLFRIFGIFSPAAALAALLLNALLSAATCLVIYRSGRAFFDEATGLLGAAAFAFNPASLWHTITTVWDVTASTLLLAVLVYSLRRLQCSPGLKPAAVAALVAGAMALFNPSCLVVYAAGVAWMCFQERKSPRSSIRLFAVLTGVPTLICVPWMVRNELVLHRLTLKSNFGTELRIGNNPLAPENTAAAVMKLHPAENEFPLYRQLGELGYVDWCRREAVTFIEDNPFAFLKLTLRRVLIFWTGSENINWTGNLKASGNWSPLKRMAMFGWAVAALFGLAVGFRYPDHILLLLTMAVYPLPYYLTHSTNRYRMPLEPILALLAAHGLVWIWRQWRRRRPSPDLRAP